MLGVGAIFQTKTRADEHWSSSPKIEVLDAIEDTAPAGAPPRRAPTTLPAAS
jgi:hypothetical protein